MSLRLLLADDHPTFRAGLRAHLDRETDLDVVGEAGTGEEAVALVRELAPDVLVLDMEMPDATGLDVVARLDATGLKTAVLVLSAFDDPAYIFGVLDAGAAGYLSKREPLASITEAIRGSGRGDVGWLSRRIGELYIRTHRTDRARKERRAQAEAALDTLTEREREVLLLVADGQTNGEIAERLFLSVSSIKKHVHTVYTKLGLRTRPQVVAWAWKSGIVQTDA